MKLKRCHIDGFGCLENRDFDFSENLTCIISDNGSGKTTLTYFIKAMFYGLSFDGKRDLSNERKRFLPWNNTVFGGNIEFECKKGEYRIERTFGKKASEDTFKLIDLSTKLESKDYTSNVGEELFGIDADSFEKSTFLPQKRVEAEMTSGISAKLGGLLEVSNDTKNFDEAKEKLEKYQKHFKLQKGDGGLIYELTEKIYACQTKITECEKAEEEITTLREELATAETERAKKVEEKTALEKEKEKQKVFEEYKNKENAKINCENALKRLQDEFENGVPTADEIARTRERITELKYLSEKEPYDTAELDKIKKKLGSVEEARKIRDKINEDLSKETKSAKGLYPILAVGGALATVGIVFLFINAITGIVGLAVAAVSITAGLLLISNCKKSAGVTEEIKKNAKDTLKKLGYADIYAFDTEIERFSFLENTAKSKEEERAKIKEQKNKLNDEIDGFFDEYGIDVEDYTRSLNETDAKIKNIEIAKESVKRAESELEKYKAENKVEERKDIYELDEKIRAITLEISVIDTNVGGKKQRITDLENMTAELPTLIEDKSRIELEKEKAKEKHGIAEKALRYLASAKTSLETKYLNPMEKGFSDVYNEIVEDGKKPEINTKLEVKYGEVGGYRENEWYSEGMRAVSAICMRIALAKCLSKDEPMFLVLDDPFCDLDGKKLERAKVLLKRLSKERQIIYTTCHESRKI